MPQSTSKQHCELEATLGRTRDGEGRSRRGAESPNANDPGNGEGLTVTVSGVLSASGSGGGEGLTVTATVSDGDPGLTVTVSGDDNLRWALPGRPTVLRG